MVYTNEKCPITMACLVTFGIIMIHAAKESRAAFANLLTLRVIMIDLSKQTSYAIPFLFPVVSSLYRSVFCILLFLGTSEESRIH